MDWAALLAHWIVNHRFRLAVIAAVLTIASVLSIVWHARFASDVLDLLPRHFDSVRVLKQFDREFSQARELTFAIVDETGDVDLDGFIEHFAEKLREQRWVARVMEKSPMESNDGIRDIQRLAVPLLLNLEPDSFAAAITVLDPPSIESRFSRLRSALEAGSPKAEFDLQFDPLGLVAPALKPLAGSLSVEQTRPLASPDGTLRVVLALTRQADLDAHSCQETMRKVDEFREQTLAEWEGSKPQVLVTGRTAYVGELSLIMRGDVRSTAFGSIVFVGVMFWLGFRRIRPLFAMMLTLMLGCLAAVAFGAFVFREMNMITIGLCAILVGLGEDFGMMFYGIYHAERDLGHGHQEAITTALRHHGRGVVFGALTTATAFLCLTVSECSGFVQLGVLIAFGIMATGALMMTVFFILLTSHHRERRVQVARVASARVVEKIWRNPRLWSIAGLVFFAGASLVGFGPFGKIEFEVNPKSLEPRHSRAGDALRLIQSKMPVAGEPVVALIEAGDSETFHAVWRQAQRHWAKLVASGELKGVNSPAAFAISPEQQAANADVLGAARIEAARVALRAAAEREGLGEAVLTPALSLLDHLARAVAGQGSSRDWRQALSADSPWWFVVDRFLGRTPQVGAAYLVPSQPLKAGAEQQRFLRSITVPDAHVHFSGWSYLLVELIPWARSKLALLTAAMVTLNVILLACLFRRWSSIGIVLTGLVLAVGALLGTLKLMGSALNIFNVLAFPLVLGVGVDYAIYLVLAMREADPQRELTTIFKPVLLSGITTVAGFASLVTAQNPALRGLGIVCALGVGWCLAATFFFVLPLVVWRDRR